MKHGKGMLRRSLLTLALLTGGLPVAYAATDANAAETTVDAVTDTATETGEAVETTARATQNRAEGFDDWGLLGLLGLFGLLGLRRTNSRSVVVDGTRR